MSILIAYKKGDTVYMGTDTRVLLNDHKSSELSKCNYKIQKMDNGMLVGIRGERKERQILFAYSSIFTLDKNGELTRKHIVKEIIPNLLKVLEQEQLITWKEGELPYMNVDLLLAHKGTLYEICAQFAVIRYEDFQALGLNGQYAQATLANTKETDDINERIVKALRLTAKHCQQVGGPYVLIDTKELSYKLVGGNESWLLR